jgi:hypothetical protein
VSVQPSPSYDELVARVAELTGLLEQALARVADLEARLKLSSANSSKPPSADGLAKPAPKSLRPRSGRGLGRPKGQDGVTLERFADPDVVRHLPAVCAGCGNGLAGAQPVPAGPGRPGDRWPADAVTGACPQVLLRQHRLPAADRCRN